MSTTLAERVEDFLSQQRIVIADVCPLMCGKPSDGFHRIFKGWLKLTGDLPN